MIGKKNIKTRIKIIEEKRGKNGEENEKHENKRGRREKLEINGTNKPEKRDGSQIAKRTKKGGKNDRKTTKRGDFDSQRQQPSTKRKMEITKPVYRNETRGNKLIRRGGIR